MIPAMQRVMSSEKKQMVPAHPRSYSSSVGLLQFGHIRLAGMALPVFALADALQLVVGTLLV